MRNLGRILFIASLLASTAASAQSTEPQTQGELTARTLYYNSGSDAEAKPAVAKQTKRTPVKTSATTSTATALSGSSANAVATTSTGAPLPDTPTPQPVKNLGVRYNVLLVDPNSNSSQIADPSSTFRNSDCLALSIQSNYDGYLYVFDRGSSGKWDVLLPSAELADESNLVKARTDTRAPGQACFSLDNPPGVEHLFVVVARSPQDIDELNKAVKASRTSDTSAGTETQRSPSIETQMARLEEGMRSRDIRITRSGNAAAGAPAHAVYVVDTTQSPSDRIVTEIQIKHN